MIFEILGIIAIGIALIWFTIFAFGGAWFTFLIAENKSDKWLAIGLVLVDLIFWYYYLTNIPIEITFTK